MGFHTRVGFICLSSNIKTFRSIIMQATMMDIIESIADDVNDTIRIEYNLGGSFTENEVDTLILSKIPTDQANFFGLEEVKELVDLNLIGV